MCQDKDHGGRRCEDNSDARRRRRKGKQSLERNKVVLSVQGSLVEAEKAPSGMKEIKESAAELGSLLHSKPSADPQEQAKQDAILEQHITRLGLSIGVEAEKRAGFSEKEYEAGLAELPQISDKDAKELTEANEKYKESLKALSEWKRNHPNPTDDELDERDRLDNARYGAQTTHMWIYKRIENIKQVRKNYEEGHLVALNVAYKEVIAEIRPVGGDFPESKHSHSEALDILRRTVGQNYPTEWIKRSEEHSELVVVSGADERAFYSPGRILPEVGKQSRLNKHVMVKNKDLDGYVSKMSENGVEVRVSGVPFVFDGDMSTPVEVPIQTAFNPEKDTMGEDGKPVGDGWHHGYVNQPGVQALMLSEKTWYRHSYEDGERKHMIELSDTYSDQNVNAYHEFCHRYEDVAPNDAVKRMEEAFLVRRTTDETGKRESMSEIFPSGGLPLQDIEVGRRDGFIDHYIGKQYLTSRSREVLSVGSEGVFGKRLGAFVGIGDYKKDLDHRGFTLGIFATA